MDICESAALRAGQTSGVPVEVLRAIARTETGRKHNGNFGPWPWTVNMEGKGTWFESDDAARAYVYKHFKRGARSFDVGCFQINYRWHHQEFASLEEMFDPLIGAKYAAKFLKELHNELGNWEAAAGAYHSRTPRHANRYKALFKQHYAKVKQAPLPSLDAAQKPKRHEAKRTNRFPLLSTYDGVTSAGSLVQFGADTPRRSILRAAAVSGVLQ
ncbi:lytic transglycosylase domain-containing protein [Lentibacter algarum]|nr:lytic transglycosylase domain-containing protein [Lentibacter algarum]MBU2981193.1 lytic transglycosylase domain-containing protein [Lentibacter algarum]